MKKLCSIFGLAIILPLIKSEIRSFQHMHFSFLQMISFRNSKLFTYIRFKHGQNLLLLAYPLPIPIHYLIHFDYNQMSRALFQMIKLFLLMHLFHPCFSLVLYKPNNLFSQNKMLFASNTSSLSYRYYSITFNLSFVNWPTVTYSLNNYQASNRFYYQNIQTAISWTGRQGFTLEVNPILITAIVKFSICYLAIDDRDNFVLLAKSYLNPIGKSQQNDYRSAVLREYYNFTRANINGAVSLRGFYVQSIRYFYISSQLANINNRSFNIIVGTYSDCSIGRLDFSIFFYYPDLAADDYLIFVSNNYCFQNTSSRESYLISLTTDTSVFFFGMTGLGGKTSDCYVDMGWTSSWTGNTTVQVSININASQLQYVCYNFIQIFALRPYVSPVIPANSTNSTNSTTAANSTTETNGTTPPPPYPTQTTSKTQQSTPRITLLIIVVVIVCTLTVLIVVICAIRHYWYTKYYEKQAMQLSKKQLSLASIQQLPTINF